jgi:hypothetical protein
VRGRVERVVRGMRGRVERVVREVRVRVECVVRGVRSTWGTECVGVGLRGCGIAWA